MELPLYQRKKILKEELQENDSVTIVDYLPREGDSYFKAVVKMGLEGIMAKRDASSYQPGGPESGLDQDQEKLNR